MEPGTDQRKTRLAAALSSTVIIVKILYDKRELDTLPGRITLGVLAGYGGGWIDRAVTWLSDVQLAIPFVVFSTFFFFFGALFSHYIAFPWTWQFFVSWQTEYMKFQPSIGPAPALYTRLTTPIASKPAFSAWASFNPVRATS